MQKADSNLVQSAAQKIATGALMTIEETAAWLDVSPQTVHRMPLKSIRLGRSLRFDPRDVSKLIEDSKEAIICDDQRTNAKIALTASRFARCSGSTRKRVSRRGNE
jgi:hypothetical protein